MRECIITNRSAFVKKYGEGETTMIFSDLDIMIAASRSRGVICRVCLVDDPVYMDLINAPVVTNAGDAVQNLAAISGINNGESPDFITLLGAQDIIPFHKLVNPAFVAGGRDPDEYIYSDLPYACPYDPKKAYEPKISNFLKPKYAVSRIPDIYNDKKYGAITLRKTIISMATAPLHTKKDYLHSCFAVSAITFKTPASESLRRHMSFQCITIHSSPYEGPNWNPALYHSLVHYFYLHGAQKLHILYGERPDSTDRPEAFCSHRVKGGLSHGAIALLQSCYGAQLYCPSYALGDMPPLANTYLSNGAMVLCGSSVATYGSRYDLTMSSYLNDYLFNHLMENEPPALAFLNARKEALSIIGTMTSMSLKAFGEWVLYAQGSAKLIPDVALPGQMGACNSTDIAGLRVAVPLANDQEIPHPVRCEIENRLVQDGFEEIQSIVPFSIHVEDVPTGELLYQVTPVEGTEVYCFRVDQGQVVEVLVYSI